MSVDDPRPRGGAHPPSGALRVLLIALTVALGGSMAAGARGLPAAAAQPVHAHALQHAGHHHVGEDKIQRMTSARSRGRKVWTRRPQVEGERRQPVRRRRQLRLPPRRWARLRPPPVTDVRSRICRIRV